MSGCSEASLQLHTEALQTTVVYDAQSSSEVKLEVCCEQQFPLELFSWEEIAALGSQDSIVLGSTHRESRGPRPLGTQH